MVANNEGSSKPLVLSPSKDAHQSDLSRHPSFLRRQEPRIVLVKEILGNVSKKDHEHGPDD